MTPPTFGDPGLIEMLRRRSRPGRGRPKAGSWYSRALAVIEREVGLARSQNKTPDETLQMIDAAYPFNERAMWPYKMWLKARRDAIATYGLKPQPTNHEHTRPDTPDGDGRGRRRRRRADR